MVPIAAPVPVAVAQGNRTIALGEALRMDAGGAGNAGGGTVVFADERDAPAGANDTQDLVTTGLPSDTPEEMLTRVLDINVKTCMNTCMAVVPNMKKQGGGKIVTVSSTAGVDARGGYHPYGTSKAAIIHYTRALAQSWHDQICSPVTITCHPADSASRLSSG